MNARLLSAQGFCGGAGTHQHVHAESANVNVVKHKHAFAGDLQHMRAPDMPVSFHAGTWRFRAETSRAPRVVVFFNLRRTRVECSHAFLGRAATPLLVRACPQGECKCACHETHRTHAFAGDLQHVHAPEIPRLVLRMERPNEAQDNSTGSPTIAAAVGHAHATATTHRSISTTSGLTMAHQG